MAGVINSQFASKVKSLPDDIDKMLLFCTKNHCSDLFIKVNEVPYVYQYGIMYRGSTKVDSITWNEFAKKAISSEMNATYVRQKLLDFQYTVQGYRYRVNASYSQDENIATFRMLTERLPSFDSLKIDPQVAGLLEKAFSAKQGITMLVGVTGSGKNLEKNTKILTKMGKKRIKDIKVGDTVFDKNGQPTKVINKYSPEEKHFYEFIFDDGTKIKSGAGHLWEVELLNEKNHVPIHKAIKLFTPNIFSKLNNLVFQDEEEISVNNYIKYLGENEESWYRWLRRSFKAYLYPKLSPYIDLNILINYYEKKSYKNSGMRIKKIKQFIKENNRVVAMNSECKKLLGTKFPEIIRESGQKFIDPQILWCKKIELSIAILNWHNDIQEAITKRNERPIKVMTTQEIINYGIYKHCNNGSTRANFSIRRPNACEYSKINLPVAAYWLGAWLGDGYYHKSSICGVDKEVATRCSKDYKITSTVQNKSIPINSWNFGPKVLKLLKENNLYKNKHIPDIYKIATIEDKLELIAGLIDTDGHVNKNGIMEISLIKKDIIYSLREICCSLGFKCYKISSRIPFYKNEKGKRINGQKVWRFSFVPNLEIPLQVPRKKKCHLENLHNTSKQQQVRHKRFYLTDAQEIPGKSEDYYCLEVDSPTHMFLCTESYLPTHNTSTLAACINTFTNGNINRNMPLKDGHVITLEDPIEYIYPPTQNTLIQQKELNKDFRSYPLGIKSALREHPTHILVGETRDTETIKALIEAVVTGHSCITTFHAGNCSETIARLFSNLVGDNQDVMFDLINCFNFILCQELIKGRGGYTLNYQYMFFTESIKQVLTQAIYDGKNIPDTVNKLMKHKGLLQAGLVGDWKYPKQ